jgi:hypothetical protein
MEDIEGSVGQLLGEGMKDLGGFVTLFWPLDPPDIYTGYTSLFF